MNTCPMCLRKHRGDDAYCSEPCRERAAIPAGFDPNRRRYTVGAPKATPRPVLVAPPPRYCGTCEDRMPADDPSFYCSDACRAVRFPAKPEKKAEKPARVLHPCPVCRKMTGERRRIYCSSRCKRDAEEQRRREKRLA